MAFITAASQAQQEALAAQNWIGPRTYRDVTYQRDGLNWSASVGEVQPGETEITEEEHAAIVAANIAWDEANPESVATPAVADIAWDEANPESVATPAVAEVFGYRRYVYDYAVDGGEIGAHQLRGSAEPVPVGAVVTRWVLDPIELLTSESDPLIKMGLEATDDIQEEHLLSEIPGQVGNINSYVLGDAGSGRLALDTANVYQNGVIKTTQERAGVVFTNSEVLTGGKFALTLDYEGGS